MIEIKINVRFSRVLDRDCDRGCGICRAITPFGKTIATCLEDRIGAKENVTRALCLKCLVVNGWLPEEVPNEFSADVAEAFVIYNGYQSSLKNMSLEQAEHERWRIQKFRNKAGSDAKKLQKMILLRARKSSFGKRVRFATILREMNYKISADDVLRLLV